MKAYVKSYRSLPRWIAALCFLFLLSDGCGGGEADPPPDDPSPDTVGPDGGTVSFDEGLVEIEIPEGALSEDVEITVTPVDDPEPGGIGQAYEFGPPGTVFDMPVTIRITYSEEDIEEVEETDYINAGELVDGEWRSIVGASFDSDERVLSFTVAGFGEATDSETEGVGSSSSALLSQTTACGDSVNLVAPASPQTVTGIPPVVVDPDRGGDDDARCRDQRLCRTITYALSQIVSPGLSSASVVVVRPGQYATTADSMMNIRGGETFPINTRLSNGAGLQLVAPSGATLIAVGSPVFETDALATSFPVVEGFTLETEPASGGDPTPRSIHISDGYAAYQDINEMMGGGVQIDGGYAFIRSSTLTEVEITEAGSSQIPGETPLVLQGNTFMGSGDIAVDVNCVTNSELYCVAICDGNTFMGSTVGIHAIGNATLRIEENTFMGSDIGILLGDLPTTDAADDLQVTLTGNTFMGGSRAKLVVSMPKDNLTESDNTFQQQAEWPTVVWNGPAPWVEPVDIAYLEEPYGSTRWWSIQNTGPSGRIGAGICYLPGERAFVMMGGRNASGTLEDTWVFDLDPSEPLSATEPSTHLQWQMQDAAFIDPLGGTPDPQRYEVAMASPWNEDDTCLLFGGHNGVEPDTVFDDLYRFNTDNFMEWERVEPDPDPEDGVPEGRYGASFNAIGTDRYVLAGGVNASGVTLDDVWVYDATANAWERRADMASARTYHGAVTSDPNVVLFWGGSGTSQENRTAYRYQYGGSGADQWLEVTGVDSSLIRSDLSLALLSRSSGQAHRYITFGGTELIDGTLTYQGESLLLTSGGAPSVSGVAYAAPTPDPEETNPPPSVFPVTRARYVMASSTSPEDYDAMRDPRTDIAVLLFGGTNDTTFFSDTWIYMPGGD